MDLRGDSRSRYANDCGNSSRDDDEVSRTGRTDRTDRTGRARSGALVHGSTAFCWTCDVPAVTYCCESGRCYYVGGNTNRVRDDAQNAETVRNVHAHEPGVRCSDDVCVNARDANRDYHDAAS